MTKFAGQEAARAWGLDSSKEAPGRRGGIGIFIVAEIVNYLSCRPQKGDVGSMLVERRNVRQITAEGFRRWFSDEYFDLIVWYAGEAQADSTVDVIAGFQLCYDKRGQERALSWRREGGFSHDLIDAGEIPGQPNMSPVLQPGGELSEAVVKKFRSNCLEVGLSLQNLVCTKLSEYRKACRRSGAGRTAGLMRS